MHIKTSDTTSNTPAETSSDTPSDPAFRYEFTVDDTVIDQNGHVNNVVYIQWMQDVAILHSTACGGLDVLKELGGSWIVRSHSIDYLSPAFVGDRIVAVTWVVSFRRVRSLRRYQFIRKSDDKVLARGTTEWVYINSTTARPSTIPEAVKACYPVAREKD